jgi:hypothetical protein
MLDKWGKGATSILKSKIWMSPNRLDMRNAKGGTFLRLLRFLRNDSDGKASDWR